MMKKEQVLRATYSSTDEDSRGLKIGKPHDLLISLETAEAKVEFRYNVDDLIERLQELKVKFPELNRD